MEGFKNILVYVDRRADSAYGLERAFHLARAQQARLRLLRVLEPVDQSRWLFSDDPMAAQIRDSILEENLADLEMRLRPIHEAGVSATAEARWGTPFVEVLREVVAGDHDLVVKTATRRGEGGPYVLGPTAMHLVRKCPCPVWVKLPKPGPSRRVLAVLDPTDGSEAQDELNRRIVVLAATLARNLGGDWHAARIWDSPVAGLSEAVRPGAVEAALSRRVADVAGAEVDRALSGCSEARDSGRVHLLRGLARDVLPRFAKREGFDIVVMGAVGAEADAGVLISESAEAVLQRIGCSVLVCKPITRERRSS